jgi:hypothetical protein
VPYDKPTEMLDMINRFIGVSDGTVNGMPSRVGEKDIDGTPSANPEPKPPVEDAPDNESTSDDEDPWSEYYNW